MGEGGAEKKRGGWWGFFGGAGGGESWYPDAHYVGGKGVVSVG